MCDQSGCVNAKSLHHCDEHAKHHITEATQQRWCVSVEVTAIGSESRRMIVKLASSIVTVILIVGWERGYKELVDEPSTFFMCGVRAGV